MHLWTVADGFAGRANDDRPYKGGAWWMWKNLRRTVEDDEVPVP